MTGIEQCQYRKARIIRNHIGGAMTVWRRLAQVARDTSRTIYQVKFGMLDDYLRQELRSPPVAMSFA